MSSDSVNGFIHSFESFATVDGPGVRFLVFLQGCPLRCLYCHNVDCREPNGGKEMSSDEVLAFIVKHKKFIQNGGGVTFSGGEPTAQPKFLGALLKGAKEAGLHTAVDTSGFVSASNYDLILPYTDLVILDIKNFDNEVYRKVTKVDLKPTLELAVELYNRNIPFWVRYVLVPGLTDNLEAIERGAEFLKDFPNLERIEVLPFHKMGEQKWERMGYGYELKETKPPTPELVSQVIEIFKKHGLKAF